MSSAQSNSEFDPFILDKIFPDPLLALSHCPPSLAELCKDCLYAFDANALITPFQIGGKSSGDVTKVFKTLSGQDRLFAPHRALQEFVKNRTKVLADVHAHLVDTRTKFALPDLQPPSFLEGNSHLAQATQAPGGTHQKRRPALSGIGVVR